SRYGMDYGVAETQRILETGQILPSAFELNKMLTGWKKLPDLAFLSDAYTDNLQQKLKDLHGAWNHRSDI
ncbi:RNA-guided endonuclease TnpB family protein, partial [Klebsiella pneumoniae]